MAEYIEREKIWPALNVACVPYNRATAKAIESIPAADVVPVVRCKDCLYGSENGFICGNVHGLQYAFPNAFCSNGAKRA